MNQLIFRRFKNNFYLYNKKGGKINIVPRRKFKNITLGIIIDTALKIPPDTGVTYRLYYLSKKLAQKGIKIKIFLCNRNFANEEDVKNLFKETSLEFHIIPDSIFTMLKN